MAKKTSEKLVSKVVSKKGLKQNAEALRSYDVYKKTSDLINRIDIALGRKSAFKSATGSTLNFEMKAHGIYSTTAPKI